MSTEIRRQYSRARENQDYHDACKVEQQRTVLSCESRENVETCVQRRERWEFGAHAEPNLDRLRNPEIGIKPRMIRKIPRESNHR